MHRAVAYNQNSRTLTDNWTTGQIDNYSIRIEQFKSLENIDEPTGTKIVTKIDKKEFR
jgi:hypothetical protein